MAPPSNKDLERPLLDPGGQATPWQKPQVEVPESAINCIFLIIFVDILAATISTPVMPFYAKMFGASTLQIGYMFAAWSFCSTVFAPLLTSAADKYGRKAVLIFALAGAAIANICQGLSVYGIEGGDSDQVVTYLTKVEVQPESATEVAFRHSMLGMLWEAISPVKWIPKLGAQNAFRVFAFFRACSGIFAAIGSVTTVYMADVVPGPLLGDYMAKLSTVGPLAFTFGPSIGGGLATIGGYNFPVLVDGVLTLFSAVVMAQSLPETPAFLRLQAERREKAKASEGRNPDGTPRSGSGSKEDGSAKTRVPAAVYLLSLSQFFGGISFSAGVSMQALFLNEVYQLDVLHVTFVSVGSAVTMVFSSMFVANPVRKFLGERRCTVVGYVLNAASLLGQFYCGATETGIWYWLSCLWVGALFSSTARSAITPLLMSFAGPENRGKVSSWSHFLMNLGRLCGPLVYGHVADIYGIANVYAIAGAAGLLQGLLPLALNLSVFSPGEGGGAKEGAQEVPGKAAPSALARRETRYGIDWQDEEGTREEIEKLGQFVANLLTKKHYKWVSRQAEVERMLELMVPVLDTETKESYEARFEKVQNTSFECRIDSGACQLSNV